MDMTSRSEKLFAAMRNGGFHPDLGGYDFDWIDSENPAEWDWQIEWLHEAEAECLADGYEFDATIYRDLREWIEETLDRPAA